MMLAVSEDARESHSIYNPEWPPSSPGDQPPAVLSGISPSLLLTADLSSPQPSESPATAQSDSGGDDCQASLSLLLQALAFIILLM